MGRHTGPKGRVNRRLGALIYEDSGAVRALERRDSPPGMSQRRRKPSNYGLALCEKQKIKYYYGLRERQLRRYFDAAKRLQLNPIVDQSRALSDRLTTTLGLVEAGIDFSDEEDVEIEEVEIEEVP